jgi:hypothetical protein
MQLKRRLFRRSPVNVKLFPLIVIRNKSERAVLSLRVLLSGQFPFRSSALERRDERRYPYPMQSGFQCSYCGEWNDNDVDESAGRLQQFVEDCQVCCQPNLLLARLDTQDGQFTIRASRES